METNVIINSNDIKNPVKRVAVKTIQAVGRLFGWLVIPKSGHGMYGEKDRPQHFRSFMLYFEKPGNGIQDFDV